MWGMFVLVPNLGTNMSIADLDLDTTLEQAPTRAGGCQFKTKGLKQHTIFSLILNMSLPSTYKLKNYLW